ncbi:MAG TPA: TAXI family TRAP transporter solute-binding subunit [Burkholderiaceae bacterium]|jgi:TRAP transporter TAXI family solute receptor|nr:TAXI family TRAP transporter solute-binding subunit [Burkholderiaceae bacterium]
MTQRINRHTLVRLACIAATGATIAWSPVMAQVKLPASMTMTAYDTGTAGFNITVAIGKMLKDKHGTDVRVLPAGNDVARLQPLRTGRAFASAMGAGVYFAQEGLFEFGSKEWGPQAVQITLTTVDCHAGSLGVAADIGVKTVADLKGKRVGFVVGSPALNQNALGVLAFGNLTIKDVKAVEFASYGAMWKGVVNNDVDAAYGTTITGPAKEVESSPRGIIWPPTPADDKAGWARLQKITPFILPHLATCGANISKEKPVQLSNYPYPIYTVYANQAENDVYMLTKAMIEGYDAYKDGAPGAAGMAAKRQTKNWSLPVHKGAVRALKEAGAWSDEQEKFNNNLYKRQEILAAAWTAYRNSNPPSDNDKFAEGWMKARAAALSKAGMEG